MKKALDFLLKYPVKIFFLLMLMSVVSIYFMNKLSVRSDFTVLLPENFQSVQNLKAVDESFGGMSHLYVVIHQTEDLQQTKNFVNEAVVALEKIPNVNYVIDKVPVDFFSDRMALYIDFADLQEIDRRVSVSLANSKKHGTSVVFSDVLDLMDPEDSAKLDLSDIQKKYQDKLNGLTGGNKTNTAGAPADELDNNPKDEGYYYSQKDKFFVIWLKSSVSFLDLDANQKLLDHVQSTLDGLNQKNFANQMHYDFTGSYKTLIDQNNHLKNQVIWVFVVVFGLMGLVITLFYRNPFYNIVIGLPLFISTTWSGAMTYFLIGHVNVITSFTGFVLMGPGSDYAIFLLDRYQEERLRSVSLSEALYKTYKSAGRSTFSAFLTTLAGFLALLFSKFLGFYEFGVVGAVGLAANYFGILLLFPSLIWIMEHFRLFEKAQFELKFLDRFSNFFGPWCRSIRYGKIFLGLTLGLLLLGLWVAPQQLRIEFKDTGIENRKILSWQLEQQVKAVIGQPMRPPTVLTHSLVEELAVVETLKTGAAKDKIKDILYLDKFVPEQQSEKRALASQIVKNFKQLNIPHDKTANDMIASIEKLPDLPDVNRENLPASLKKVFLPFTTEHGIFSAVYVFHQKLDLGTQSGIKLFPKLFGAIALPNGVVLSTAHEAFVVSDILQMVESEGPKLVGLIFLFLAISVAVDFRNARKFFVNFLPMLMTIPVMTACMYLFGVGLNVLNVSLIPVIFGVGIDNFLHYFHFYEEHKHNEQIDFEKISLGILPSIFMASFTSMIGFGGFIVASTPYLRSMGWLSIIGITIIFLMVSLMFPKWIQLFAKK